MINVLTKIKMEIFRSALDNHWKQEFTDNHSVKKDSTVTTMLTHTWKSKVLHCNHLGNTWRKLVLIIRCFDYRSVWSSVPVGFQVFPRWLQCKTVHFQVWVSMVVTGFFFALCLLSHFKDWCNCCSC